MRVDPRLGTYAEVAAAAGPLAPVLDAVRALVAEGHPDATEAASAKERSLWWGFGPRKMRDGYAWAIPYAAHVGFGFFHAAELPDPDGLLEGTGARIRHVKLRRPEDVRRPGVVALLAAARDERRRALNLA